MALLNDYKEKLINEDPLELEIENLGLKTMNYVSWKYDPLEICEGIRDIDKYFFQKFVLNLPLN